MKEYTVKAISSKLTIRELRIKFSQVSEGNNVFSALECNCNDFNIITKEYHTYTAFEKLRVELEKHDLFLWCKGCLVNVHPSGRQLISTKAYKLKLGQRTSREDVVDIFDPIDDIGELVSIQNQSEYYDLWLESIKGVR